MHTCNNGPNRGRCFGLIRYRPVVEGSPARVLTKGRDVDHVARVWTLRSVG